MEYYDEFIVKTTPYLHIHASDFFVSDSFKHLYDAKVANDKYFSEVTKAGNTKVERIVIKDSDHMTFCDFKILFNYESAALGGSFWPPSQAFLVQ